VHAHIEALVYVDALLAVHTEDGHQEAEECKDNLHLSSVNGALKHEYNMALLASVKSRTLKCNYVYSLYKSLSMGMQVSLRKKWKAMTVTVLSAW